MLQLTEEVFAELIRELNMSERPATMARDVLVLGKRQADVAREHSVSRNAVSLAVNRVARAYSDVPDGYERVTVVVPRAKVDLLRKLQSTFASELDRQK